MSHMKIVFNKVLDRSLVGNAVALLVVELNDK